MKLAREDRLMLITIGHFLVMLFIAIEIVMDMRLHNMKEVVGIVLR